MQLLRAAECSAAGAAVRGVAGLPLTGDASAAPSRPAAQPPSRPAVRSFGCAAHGGIVEENRKEEHSYGTHQPRFGPAMSVSLTLVHAPHDSDWRLRSLLGTPSMLASAGVLAVSADRQASSARIVLPSPERQLAPVEASAI